MTRRIFTSLFALLAIATVAMAHRLADEQQVKQLRETGICQNCDLRDADLGGIVATDLRNSDLRGAMLYKAVLKDADLSGALLAFANLKGANLRGSKGANLEGALTDERTICPSGWAGPCTGVAR